MQTFHMYIAKPFNALGD